MKIHIITTENEQTNIESDIIPRVGEHIRVKINGKPKRHPYVYKVNRVLVDYNDNQVLLDVSITGSSMKKKMQDELNE